MGSLEGRRERGKGERGEGVTEGKGRDEGGERGGAETLR